MIKEADPLQQALCIMMAPFNIMIKIDEYLFEKIGLVLDKNIFTGTMKLLINHMEKYTQQISTKLVKCLYTNHVKRLEDDKKDMFETILEDLKQGLIKDFKKESIGIASTRILDLIKGTYFESFTKDLETEEPASFNDNILDTKELLQNFHTYSIFINRRQKKIDQTDTNIFAKDVNIFGDIFPKEGNVFGDLPSELDSKKLLSVNNRPETVDEINSSNHTALLPSATNIHPLSTSQPPTTIHPVSSTNPPTDDMMTGIYPTGQIQNKVIVKKDEYTMSKMEDLSSFIDNLLETSKKEHQDRIASDANFKRFAQ